MKKGLRRPFDPDITQHTPRLQSLPDEEGIETDRFPVLCVRCSDGCSHSLMKKGLRHPVTTTFSISFSSVLQSLPDEEGIETSLFLSDLI